MRQLWIYLFLEFTKGGLIASLSPSYVSGRSAVRPGYAFSFGLLKCFGDDEERGGPGGSVCVGGGSLLGFRWIPGGDSMSSDTCVAGWL